MFVDPFEEVDIQVVLCVCVTVDVCEYDTYCCACIQLLL